MHCGVYTYVEAKYMTITAYRCGEGRENVLLEGFILYMMWYNIT